MDTIGAVIGPLAAYLILRNFPLRFDLVFLIAFFVGILSLFTLFFIKDISLALAEAKPAALRGSFARLSPQYRHFIIATFILSIGSLPVAVLLLATTSAGLIIADIPLFYMLYNISYAAFSIPAGALSDRIGARSVICIGYGALLAGYATLAFAHSTPALIGSFLLLGLFPAFTDGVQRSFASQLTQQGVRGGGLGWLNAANGFGALIAGIAGGWLWQAYNPATAFLAGGVVVIVGLVLLLNSVRAVRV